MNEILNKLIESLNNGNILVAIVIISIAIIFNYKKIIEFIEDRKKAKIIKLTEALNCDHITGLTKSHLENELATEQFKITTGIRLEKEFREALIQAHCNTNGELNFVHFKRAIPHISYKNSKVEVKISKFEYFIYLFNLVFGLALALTGMVLMVLPSQIKGISFIQIFSILGLGIFFLSIALFMLFQTFPVVSAKMVEKELKKDHNQQSECITGI